MSDTLNPAELPPPDVIAYTAIGDNDAYSPMLVKRIVADAIAADRAQLAASNPQKLLREKSACIKAHQVVLAERDAEIADLRAQLAQQGQEPVELMGVREAIAEGDGFWRSCSGCYDTEDGHPTAAYAYSSVFGCALGNGCSECGGIGAVWDNTDYEEMASDWDADTAPASAQPAEGDCTDGGKCSVGGYCSDCRYAAPQPAARVAVPDEQACEPRWLRETCNQGYEVDRCANCGTYKGNPCRRAASPATLTAPAQPDHETIVQEGENLVCTACGTAAPAAQQAAPNDSFQHRVQPWMMACFGPAISTDSKERNHRFFEESAELVQACGMPIEEAHMLVDYVYGRQVGEKAQEVGGVMVTLAALCLAQGIDMHNAGEVELARIWTKMEAIRAKQASKPKNSPLPVAAPATAGMVSEMWDFSAPQERHPLDTENPELNGAIFRAAVNARDAGMVQQDAKDAVAAALRQASELTINLSIPLPVAGEAYNGALQAVENYRNAIRALAAQQAQTSAKGDANG